MEDGGDLAEDSAAAKAEVEATWKGAAERAARRWRQLRGRSPGVSPRRAVPTGSRERGHAADGEAEWRTPMLCGFSG